MLYREWGRGKHVNSKSDTWDGSWRKLECEIQLFAVSRFQISTTPESMGRGPSFFQAPWFAIDLRLTLAFNGNLPNPVFVESGSVPSTTSKSPSRVTQHTSMIWQRKNCRDRGVQEFEVVTPFLRVLSQHFFLLPRPCHPSPTNENSCQLTGRGHARHPDEFVNMIKFDRAR